MPGARVSRNSPQIALLKKRIDRKIKTALVEDVGLAVQDIMIRKIKKHVYDRYTPRRYVRQRERGGLIDRGNIPVKLKGNLLEVRNIRSDKDRYVAQLVELGWGNMDQPFNRPRPFTLHTRNLIKRRRIHVKALAGGLRRQGVRTLN